MKSIRGQAMVEAAGAIGLLFLFFVCNYHIFRIVLDKIHSLDTVYHLARTQQVRPHNGPMIQEITFSFHPHSLHFAPWKSSMRITLPQSRFLNVSWPGAGEDGPAGPQKLAKETAVMRLRALADQDTLLDAAADLAESRR